jgi:hypothetical protein
MMVYFNFQVQHRLDYFAQVAMKVIIAVKSSPFLRARKVLLKS